MAAFVRIAQVAVLLIMVAAVPPTPAAALEFPITKIIDATTPRPDGGGNFGNPHSPSTDGRHVVWAEETTLFSIWSQDLKTSRLVKLADGSTPVPGGTGSFTCFGQFAGGIYAGFDIAVRRGTAVFLGCDSGGNGLYSVPARSGEVQLIANENTVLPNGGSLGGPGHGIVSFGLSDSGAVTFDGLADGIAPDGLPLGQSVYTASADGSNLALIADQYHMFFNPSQPAGTDNVCVQNFGAAAVGGGTVAFGGGTGNFASLYAQPVGSTPLGTNDDPPGFACGTGGDTGPVVWNTLSGLPGDPAANPIPTFALVQTDGRDVVFLGFDFSIGCCSSVNGQWAGIFSVPIAGGPVKKIVADGDTLPAIGQVTDLADPGFSVDDGGVAFIAINETASPPTHGIFFYEHGHVHKVFASGDRLDGGRLDQNGALEIWPEALKDGKLAFIWNGGLFVADLCPALPHSGQCQGGQ